MLEQCLTSLLLSQNVDIETIIVENGSYEKINTEQISAYPNVHILHFERKLGFAGACNRGVEAASGKYIFLLNNDAIIEPDTLFILSQAMDNDELVAACQPKILSLRNKKYFDYSSACGGEIDIYGYPFARGRVFDTVEEDNGQYNQSTEIFWGAGAALMIRRDLYEEAGGLEEPYFAHMEEIDLQWRFHLMGFKVMVIPDTKVYHLGAATIGDNSFIKMYLNHRNNLAMVFSNFSTENLVRFLPVRWVLDLVLAVYSIFRLDFKRSLAVICSGLWFLTNLSYLIRCRKRSRKLRRVSEDEILKKIYPRSVVWQYFIRRRKTYTQLI